VSDYCHISWETGEARVKSFSAANRGKATTVKIELEITDPRALAYIISQLHEAQQPPKRIAPVPTKSRARSTATEQLALPGPVLRLSDLRGGRR